MVISGNRPVSEIDATVFPSSRVNALGQRFSSLQLLHQILLLPSIHQLPLIISVHWPRGLPQRAISPASRLTSPNFKKIAEP